MEEHHLSIQANAVMVSAGPGRPALNSFHIFEIQTDDRYLCRLCSIHTRSEPSDLYSPQTFSMNGRHLRAQHSSRVARAVLPCNISASCAQTLESSQIYSTRIVVSYGTRYPCRTVLDTSCSIQLCTEVVPGC